MVDLAEAGRNEREHPIAEPTPVAALSHRATQRRRRRRALSVALPLAAVLTGVAIVASTRRGPHPQRVIAAPTASAPTSVATPVTLPDVHPPAGSAPLDYGGARIWVPAGWRVVGPGTESCSGDLDKVVLVGGARLPGPACLASSDRVTAPRVGSFVQIGPIGHSGAAGAPTRLVVNGVSVEQLPASAATTYPGEVIYEVPDLGAAITGVGPGGRAVMATLGPSARHAVLSDRPQAPGPAGWRAVHYEGVALAVPASWPVHDPGTTSVQPGCDTASPFPSPAVDLGARGAPPGCPATGPYPGPADGVWLHPRPPSSTAQGPVTGRLVHDGPVRAYLAPGAGARQPPSDALDLAGPTGPLELGIGFGTDPAIAEHIIDSITTEGAAGPTTAAGPAPRDCAAPQNDCTATQPEMATAPRVTHLTPPAGGHLVQRLDALSMVASDCAELRTITHMRSKLASWGAVRAAGGADQVTGTTDSQLVWVVAVSGEIEPAFAHGAVFGWGTEFVSATTGGVLSLAAGHGPWPPYFDGLADQASDGQQAAGDTYARGLVTCR